MGMLCYSVVKEQRRDFSPSLFLHNTKRLKRNALKKIFTNFSNCRLYLRITCSDTPYFFAIAAVQDFFFPAR